MKKKIIIFSIIALGLFAFVQNTLSFAQASGGFEITYLNLPLSGPVFNIHNMLPGDCVTRTIKAKNNGHQSINLSVKSTNEEDAQNLSTQITLEIKEGSNVYFSDTLKNFYDAQSVSLGSLGNNQELSFQFKACFSFNAGNEYQDTETEFDLVFSTRHGSTPPQLPAECKDLHIEKFIIGDSGNNHLSGTSDSDYIEGKEGNDHLEGGAGKDCIVGGEGNDKIDGQSGEDILLGNGGNDDVRGGSSNDYLDGGSGNDKLDGDTGTDKCVNGENLHSCEI